MDLQIALLLVGLVIVAVVALTSVDRARAARRLREQSKKSGAGIVRFAREVLTNTEGRLRPFSRLDVNPGPLNASDARALRSDAIVPDLSAPTDEPVEADPFLKSLESIEQAAAFPLDVGFDQDLTSDDDIITADEVSAASSGYSQMPSSVTDFIIDLPGKGPVRRDRALGIYKQNEYVLEKRRAIYGLRYVEGIWSNLDGDPETMQYSDLSLAIQLADRHGPIGESELNSFSQIGLKLADTLKRPCKHPLEFEEAMERAGALDAFCKQFDAIASIHVVPAEGAGFRGNKLDHAARKQGMYLGEMSIYHRKNPEAMGCRHMFSMANLYEPGTFDADELDNTMVRGVALFMQIPIATGPVEVFAEMVKAADELSSDLGGKMTDPDGKELDQNGINIITAQIREMADEMNRFNIPPGSETALRLFDA
jgi:hypothetical protein